MDDIEKVLDIRLVPHQHHNQDRQEQQQEDAHVIVIDADLPASGPREVFVKYRGLSYRRCEWLAYDKVVSAKKQLLTNFEKRQRDPEHLLQMANECPHYVHGMDPAWLEASASRG